MKNLRVGRYYTQHPSSLMMQVLSIRYIGETYIKIKGALYTINGNHLIEKKDYKLFYKNISMWRDVNEKR